MGEPQMIKRPEVDFIEDLAEVEAKLDALQTLENAILRSPEYRVLYGKTQMFYGDDGRSRGGHSHNIGITSGNMAAIAFDIAHEDRKNTDSVLFQKNREVYVLMARIMGFSHDLGHTPMGHDGEFVLDEKLGEMTLHNPQLAAEVEAQRREDFAGISLVAELKADGSIPRKKEKGVREETFTYEDYQRKKREQELGDLQEKGKAREGDAPPIGYEHNEYSAQIFSRIFKQLMADFEEQANSPEPEIAETARRELEGLKRIDPTRFVNAILAHSRSRFPSIPDDLLAQIVRQSDKVEYMNYDFDEYRSMGFFPFDQEGPKRDALIEVIKKKAKDCGYDEKYIEDHLQEIIDELDIPADQRRAALERAMVEEALVGIEADPQKGIEAQPPKGKIDDKMASMKSAKICASLKDDALFHFEDVRDEQGNIVGIKRGTITGNNVERTEVMLDRLVQYFVNNPDKIPTTPENVPVAKLREGEDAELVQNGEVVESFNPDNIARDNPYERIKTYVTTLTNERLNELYKQLVQERITQGPGHGIEPITRADIQARMRKAYEKTLKDPAQRTRKDDTDKYMTDAMKERIKRNMARHEAETEMDQQLHDQMVAADKARETQQAGPAEPQMASDHAAEMNPVQVEQSTANEKVETSPKQVGNDEISIQSLVENAINQGVTREEAKMLASVERDSSKEAQIEGKI